MCLIGGAGDKLRAFRVLTARADRCGKHGCVRECVSVCVGASEKERKRENEDYKRLPRVRYRRLARTYVRSVGRIETHSVQAIKGSLGKRALI